MSRDIEETMKKAEEAIANLDTMANQSLDDADQKMKKTIVYGVLFMLLTVVIYFMWGTTWYFWLSLSNNVITLFVVLFVKRMMFKVRKKMSEN